MSFLRELKRRNVVRVGIAYVVGAWLLMQFTDVLLQLLELPPGIGKYVVLGLTIGFPIALFFAWAFELTPEGIKREDEVDRSDSITNQTGKKLDKMIIGALALVVAWFLFDEFYLEPRERGTGGSGQASEQQAEVAAKSLAVLPFRAMSSGEDDEYFADGLTEEILNSLAAVPELLVTARTSSFFYKDKDLPVTEIAQKLGVEHVVEGSVRRSGEHVRITAQLVRAEDGFHLWSQTYDRTLEDVFAVQEDIATNIAEALDVLLDDERVQQMKNAGIGNVEAFIAYQKGLKIYEDVHALGRYLSAENLIPANENFDRALELAPGQMTIEIQRTDYYGHILYDDATGKSPQSDEVLADAQHQIVSSLESARREARDPMQRAVLDTEASLFNPNWSSMPAKFDRSLSEPHCIPGNWASQFGPMFGWAEGFAAQGRVREKCDPLSITSVWNGMFSTIWAGRPEEALAWANERVARVGEEPWSNDVRMLAHAAIGDIQDHELYFLDDQSESIFPFLRYVGPWAFVGDLEKASAAFEQYKDIANFQDMSQLITLAWMGRRDEANEWAARMDARPGGFLTLGSAVYTCMCGAPWDIENTPNFKARLDSAGFAWPPASPINAPLKDW